MGLEWDPDGDAERRKESRARMWLTIAIVLAVLGYIGRWLYQEHQRAKQEQIQRGFEEVRRQRSF